MSYQISLAQEVLALQAPDAWLQGQQLGAFSSASTLCPVFDIMLRL